MSMRQPTWQVDACPSWCAGGHLESDHPDDRVHRSAGMAVPLIVRRTIVDNDRVSHGVQGEEFDVALSRVDGEKLTWLYIGTGPAQYLDLPVESAVRLVEQARVLLNRAGGS